MVKLTKVRSLSLIVALSLVLELTFLGVGTTHAAPSRGQCIVHLVYLHGSQPATMRCALYSSAGIVSSFGVSSPAISEGTCSTGYKLYMNSYYQGSYCFYGTGYIGLGDGHAPSGIMYTVNDVISNNCGIGWVRYYLDSPGYTEGHTFSIGCNDAYDSYNSVFDGNSRDGYYGPPKVTQVDITS